MIFGIFSFISIETSYESSIKYFCYFWRSKYTVEIEITIKLIYLKYNGLYEITRSFYKCKQSLLKEMIE